MMRASHRLREKEFAQIGKPALCIRTNDLGERVTHRPLPLDEREGTVVAMGEMTNRIALVTGASSGIGLATADVRDPGVSAGTIGVSA
jgi:hypothetical protein